LKIGEYKHALENSDLLPYYGEPNKILFFDCFGVSGWLGV
jgi:hypothetical protein